MITCPWCGTNYLTFQSNCGNCGGPLPGEGADSAPDSRELPVPPAAPRAISSQYVWKLFLSDGIWIVILVFGILGAVFSLVGFGLVLGIVTALIGIIFLIPGVLFLGGAAILFFWRYQKAQKGVRVLREGEVTLGRIREVGENYNVIINGRHPWLIQYDYEVNELSYSGKVTTLNRPGQQLREGNPARILYLAAEPKWSSIYPHP